MVCTLKLGFIFFKPADTFGTADKERVVETGIVVVGTEGAADKEGTADKVAAEHFD